MSDNPDIIIVGGGAAGCAAALFAAERGKRVTLIEKNTHRDGAVRLGFKLSITGKGRCNLTNNCPADEFMANIPRNPRFVYSALSRFSPQDTMALFERLGVPLKTERGKRVFPASDKAVDIVNALEKRLKKLGVRIEHGDVSSIIIEDGHCAGVRCGDKSCRADAVIVAAGGACYPKTGSDGSGYALAKQAGHTVVPPTPSLVPMETTPRFPSAAGLALKNVSLSLFHGEKKLFEGFGEMSFMEYGVSGPLVLSASAFVKDTESGAERLVIDLKPALSEEKLDARLLRDIAANGGGSILSCLRGLLPAALAEQFPALCGLPADKRLSDLTREERRRVLSRLKRLELRVDRPRPLAEAIVTRGGVSVKELSPKTMESKLCKRLFFAGEIIDTDALTGGFNLQIAFSEAYAAASGASGEL